MNRNAIGTRQDVYAGLFFTMIGIGFIGFGWNLPFGTLRTMGPGFLPTAVASLLVIVGLGLLLKACVRSGRAVSGVAWRPLLAIPFATIAFAVSLEWLGIVVATFLAVAISRLASPGQKPLQTLALAAGLAVFCVVVFVKGFGMPVPIWPWH